MSCYCISHKDVKSETDEPSSSMDLDAALQEQCMLTKITDSRKNYLEEKIKKKRSSCSLSSTPLCVVQMNSKFITQFSLSTTKNFPAAEIVFEEEKTVGTPEIGVAINNRTQTRSSRHRYWRRRARDKPYDPIFRKKVIPRPCIPTAEDRASPPSVSRQDSGNKSNPSSPVKSQNSLPPSGSSIVRSRSLDDLEIAKGEDCKKDCYGCYARSDIETVSQRISKLHVS